MDKNKNSVIVQKKDEKLPHLLRGVYAVILFLLVIYYAMSYPFCNSGFNSNAFALALVVLVVISLILKSPPLALITIAMVAIWFYLAPLCPAPPRDCTFQPGFSCVTSKLTTDGYLYLVISEGTGHPIIITGINCTQNTSFSLTNGIIPWGNSINISMTSGSSAVVAQKGIYNVTCNYANGTAITDQPSGAGYAGRIYIKYTEVDTGIQRIAVGTLSTKYEA